MRVAFKIAYDGRLFHGFARQPDLRTVEGEVLFALRKSAIVGDPEVAGVRGASRTDAGVSAIGNVVAFDAEDDDPSTVGRFNDAAKDVWAWAIAELPAAYNPRKARSRWYRYFLWGNHDVMRLNTIAQTFVGPHDFAAFASPDAERTRRVVDSISIGTDKGGIVIDVRAPSFLRGMVRRLVSAILAVEQGHQNVETLRAALSIGNGPDLGLAPPEPLVLMDVDLGFPFRPEIDRAAREQIALHMETIDTKNRFWQEFGTRAISRHLHQENTKNEGGDRE